MQRSGKLPKSLNGDGFLTALYLADIYRMQVCLLGQTLLAQTCLLAEDADVSTEVLPNFADS